MKRLITTLLVVVMLLGLCACGGSDTPVEETVQSTTAANVTTATTRTPDVTDNTTADTTTTTAHTTTTAADTIATTAGTTTATMAGTSGTVVTTTTTRATAAPTKVRVKATLDGVSLSDYTIVVAENGTDYASRAADYIRHEIRRRTGADVAVVSDNRTAAKHEIVVGETNRPISQALNANTAGVQFSLLAQGGHVALEGDYFIIAAAAYYFIDTYVTGPNGTAKVPAKTQVLEPIQEKANNYILCIGDGMGVEHTLLPNEYNLAHMTGDGVTNFTDNEQFFYGYLLPYEGRVRTKEVHGYITDSAAAATALATGYKTSNGRIGKDKDKNDLKSITELAGELGMNTAVMTTESKTAATPGGFSAHADDRALTVDIKADQEALSQQYGTIIKGKYDYYNHLEVTFVMESAIHSTLEKVSEGDKGFFMMYEEAYIDKHSHNQEKEKATWAVYRFNQAIARFMEFAFYHPDTMLIITADHETGGLTNVAGNMTYSHGNHTDKKVPIFAYGVGAEVFHNKEIENVQIPKTIANMWGHSLAADTDEQYPPLH